MKIEKIHKLEYDDVIYWTIDKNYKPNYDKMENLKLAIDQESVNIYIDNGEDKEPTHIHYWHMDEWKEDSDVVISILNAVQMFYTDKQKLINIIK